MIKLLKSKSGMTLTELLVGMVVFSIITAATTAILGPALNAFARANDLAEINLLLDNIAAEIEMDIAGAVKVEISGSNSDVLAVTTNTGRAVYSVSGGYLQKDGSAVLHSSYYKNMRVAVKYTALASSGVNIEITLSDRTGNVVASRDYAVAPVGM